MTDPYAETDEWPTTPAAPEPSGSTPEAGEGARVARYAEAIHPAAFACNCGRPNSRDRAVARAVMAVADQETAELRAEVEQFRRSHYIETARLREAQERAEAAEAKVLQAEDERNAALSTLADYEERVAQLERGGRELGRILDRTLRDALDASGRHDAIQEDGDGDWAVVWETLAGLRPRAEAAEAEVERLQRSLENHERWRSLWEERAEAESARLASVVELHKKALNVALNLVGIHPDLHTKDDREALEGCRMVLDDEPAALASVAPDTATPGEAGCPTCGKAREDITPGPHREGWGVCPESFHFRATSSADDKAGE